MVLADGCASRAAPERAIGIHRDIDVFQVLGVITENGDRPHLEGLGINQADPRQLHAAELHRGVTDLQEQLFLAYAVHDGLVTLTQCGIELRVSLE
jgi:hypothetical protein